MQHSVTQLSPARLTPFGLLEEPSGYILSPYMVDPAHFLAWWEYEPYSFPTFCITVRLWSSPICAVSYYINLQLFNGFVDALQAGKRKNRQVPFNEVSGDLKTLHVI